MLSYSMVKPPQSNFLPQKEKLVLDLETKMRIINDCKMHKQSKVAEMYSIHPTTVSKVVKEKDQIAKMYNYQKYGITPPVDNTKAAQWSVNEVREWVNTLNLSPWINMSGIFESVNGQLLREMYEMKKTAPEFYYNFMKQKFTSPNKLIISNGQLDMHPEENFRLHDLLKFSNELNELFKSK